MTQTGGSVLVVEDEKLLSWSLAQSLVKWGFAVQPVFTGRDAVAQSQRCAYDFVLLDYQLPDVDGLEVARSIRRARPGVTIFLLTAFQWSELAVDEGLIDAYFNKPVDLKALRRTIGGFGGKVEPRTADANSAGEKKAPELP